MDNPLWHDKMNIYRLTDNEVNGVTKSTETLIASDVSCHYSKGKLTTVGDDGAPTLVNTYTLFCSIGTDIKEGDKVIVTQRSGKKVTLTVGEGFPYSMNQEFSVKRNEKA